MRGGGGEGGGGNDNKRICVTEPFLWLKRLPCYPARLEPRLVWFVSKSVQVGWGGGELLQKDFGTEPCL